MDKESLIAGLLHDTVEDNPAQITFEEIGVSSCSQPVLSLSLADIKLY